MTRTFGAFVVLLLLAGVARAQDPASRDVLFLPSVQYGGPLRISGGLAVFVPMPRYLKRR